MGAAAGIIAFLTALPKIIDLMNRLGNLIIANNMNAWITDLESTVNTLEAAKTSEEKLDAAKKLADLIHNIKR